jgi:hypothetical protein
LNPIFSESTFLGDLNLSNIKESLFDPLELKEKQDSLNKSILSLKNTISLNDDNLTSLKSEKTLLE